MLPDVQADALRLRFFAGLKFHEIADTMSCSLSAAKNRVRTGLQVHLATNDPAGSSSDLRVGNKILLPTNLPDSSEQ